MCIVEYQRHGTFRPVNVLKVQWHSCGDIGDAEEYSSSSGFFVFTIFLFVLESQCTRFLCVLEYSSDARSRCVFVMTSLLSFLLNRK